MPHDKNISSRFSLNEAKLSAAVPGYRFAPSGLRRYVVTGMYRPG